MRRGLLVLATVVVVAVGAWFLWPEPEPAPVGRSQKPSTHRFAGRETYRDDRLGFSLRHPHWHVQVFEDDEFRYAALGILVSSVDYRFRHPQLGGGRWTNSWDMRNLPPGAVVIEFSHQTSAFFTGATCTQGPDKQSFPLDLDAAQLDDRNYGDRAHGAHIPRLWLPLKRINNDRFLYLTVWLGPAAEGSDRRTAERIVASITPPTYCLKPQAQTSA